jgi:peroxiredoxin Q/BCP
MLQMDQSAPNFNLPDQNGNSHQLSHYLGKWVVLYFYPKDMTPGCTTEACSFRDHNQTLQQQKAVILGISADSVASHQKFAQKHQLPFPILSDDTKTVVKDYGVWRHIGIQRSTYLINPAGKIAKIYPKVNPKTHVAEILHDLHELQ